MRTGLSLLAEMRVRVPDAVEQHEQDTDVMAIGDLEKLIHPSKKAVAILLPQEVVDKDSDTVEAQRLGEAQLAVDGRGVEAIRLPHLELVYRGCGNEVGSDEPALLLVPRVRLARRPSLSGAERNGGEKNESRDDEAHGDSLLRQRRG